MTKLLDISSLLEFPFVIALKPPVYRDAMYKLVHLIAIVYVLTRSVGFVICECSCVEIWR